MTDRQRFRWQCLLAAAGKKKVKKSLFVGTCARKLSYL
jgi:hypothetical protein